MYLGGPFDPEGLLTTLPAILTTWIGFLFGCVLFIQEDHLQRLRLWLRYSIILILTGFAVGFAIPINKQLWTPSYAIFTAGMAGLLFSACYLLIEIKDHKAWFKPFIMLGLNPLIIFWASGIFARSLMAIKISGNAGEIALWSAIYQNGFRAWLPDYPASLLFALANVLWWILIAWYLWTRKWFFRL